ncbi:hypothetical protein DFJ58DRAFT_917496 [Suillus subalutaceus]|uniref:uncharacterized protein n=1 Tax=Suillus subalutaceus TaxID=48586 RepID=UPI001B87D879|nr:uncharacterized protein DFJ58DRAFT_917496 [Suillus subalutaceus]KAG1836976.1 hypothetical protein DFJ58DRAFT_917496 [Suillus subalutaceus]
MCIIHVEDGLVKYRDPFLGGPVACLTDISQPMFVVNNAIYTLQNLLGDGEGELALLAKDISMLRRLAICLDYNPTMHDAVRRCKFGCNHIQKVMLMLSRSVWCLFGLRLFANAHNQPGLYNGNRELYTTVHRDRGGEDTMYWSRYGYCGLYLDTSLGDFPLRDILAGGNEMDDS